VRPKTRVEGSNISCGPESCTGRRRYCVHWFLRAEFLNERMKLGGPERLGQVCTGTSGHAVEFVAGVCACGNYEKQGLRNAPESAGHVVAVEVRQANVEGDQSQFQPLGCAKAGRSACFGVDLKACPGEEQAEQAPDIQVIFDDKANTV
jgi:hypothetical protein